MRKDQMVALSNRIAQSNGVFAPNDEELVAIVQALRTCAIGSDVPASDEADPQDEGPLHLGVAHDDEGIVHMNFGKPIAWIGMEREHAINLARMLLTHAGVKKVELEL